MEITTEKTDNNMKKRKHSEKCEMEQSSMWKNLPNDILEQIMKRLPLREYLAMKAICFPWWISVSNVTARDNCRPLLELPLILLRNKDSMFYSLSTESLHRPKTQLFDDNQFCFGSVEGWLIVGDYALKPFMTFFILNPVTNIKLMLPPLVYIPFSARIEGDLYVEKMVVSFETSSTLNIAILLSDFNNIVVYNPLDDVWTTIKPFKGMGTILDMEIIGSKLYIAINKDSDSILSVCDLNGTTDGPPKAEVLTKLPLLTPTDSIKLEEDDMIFIIHFLGKDEALKELYFICMVCILTPVKVARIEVYKLDMNKEPIEWQSVRLDDRVAFVSSCKSMIISRDKLNYNKELISGNSVYFGVTIPFIPSCYGSSSKVLKLGKFCLTDSSIKYFPVQTSSDSGVPYPIWVVPSL
ncbi:uncharacterized protein [Cicer arietinum]|uniref:Uncharacterized protein LOC101499454 n=1 Tax=Cicer arietinum TaxID=3827 RepID=A0A1S2XRI2_CICAR|nr:uncharacterized protein LOC101499454 [Cicer arietinum]